MKLSFYSIKSTLLQCALLLSLGCVPQFAFAEGSAQVNVNSRIQSSTVMYVDIIDATTERIRWSRTSGGNLQVRNPAGVLISTLGNNANTGSLAAHGNGAYQVTLTANQTGTWDIAVVNSSNVVQAGGRLWSTKWDFFSNSFTQATALTGSFFALVPAGATGRNVTVELRMNGFQGNQYSVTSNQFGVNGLNGGRSVPVAGNSVTPQFPLYLNVQALATYNPLTPTVSLLDFEPISGSTCPSTVVVGIDTGAFAFTTNATGTYALICDLDKDGIFDSSNNNDLFLRGLVAPGANSVTWDGTDRNGVAVPQGVYQCKVKVGVGESHYAFQDAETSYLGMRFLK